MRNQVAMVAFLAAAGAACAQTGPVLDVVREIDTATGADNVVSITIERGGIVQTISAADFIGINVLDFATATPPLGGPALFGVPNPVDEPGIPGSEITVIPPAPGSRISVIEDGDLAVNSAVNNPGVINGLEFEFVNGGIINGIGADLLLFELSPPEGVAPVGDPENPSVGGDPFVLSGVGAQAGNRAEFGPDVYGNFGPVANAAFFGSGTLGGADASVANLAEFESIEVNGLVVTGPASFSLNVVAIDLSDLGFAEGEIVSQLELLSTETLIENDLGGLSGPFGVDPALIVGLNPVPAPGSAAALAVVAALAARRRR